MAKVLIAEDHPLFRDALRDVLALLFEERGWRLSCLEAGTRHELLRVAEQEDDLDLILLDLFLPDGHGLHELATLRSQLPGTPVVVISMASEPETMRHAMACGAAGFIRKSAPKQVIERALRIVLDGGIYVPMELLEPTTRSFTNGEALTPRQLAVLARLAEGKSNKEIARALAISDLTVKAHVTAVLRKLGLGTRAQAIVALRDLHPDVLRSM